MQKFYWPVFLGVVLITFTILCLGMDKYAPAPHEEIYLKTATLKNVYIDHEHPSLVKIFSAFTRGLFHSRLGDLYATRLATMINFSLLVGIIYAFAAMKFGLAAGLLAAVFLPLIPDAYHYAHLAEINVNLALLWMLTFIFFLGAEKNKYLFYLSAAIWGLALGVKVTSLIIPLAMLVYLIIFRHKKFLKVMLSFVALGLLVFFLSWPYLWPSPFSRLASHVQYHLAHLSKAGPSEIWQGGLAFISNIPIVILVLGMLGIVKIIRERDREGLLFLFPIIGLVILFSFPLLYPGEKLRYYLPVLPFFCLLAGRGCTCLWTWIKNAFSS